MKMHEDQKMRKTAKKMKGEKRMRMRKKALCDDEKIQIARMS
jgi:hypothetical protein